MKQTYINISTITIIKIFAIIILFFFLYIIREILAIIFIALILYSAVNPWVDWMARKKIPRFFGILMIYIVLFSFIGAVIVLLIPPIIEQISAIKANFPAIIEKLVSGFSVFKEYTIEFGILDQVKNNFNTIGANLQSMASGIFSTITNIFGGVVTFFLILVIAFYMVVEEDAMKKIVWSIVPKQHQVYIMRLINRMQQKIGLWLRGQIILSFIIFLLTYIALSIVHAITGQMEYALVLALLAGLTEFVPYLGPVLAAIPAVFLAFTQSPTLALIVFAIYYVIQWLENNIIVPKLMQKVVGLNPIVSIVVILIGFKIGGIIGAVFSMPVATALSVFIKDVFEKNVREIEE
ncbi:MAG: AI-2E family transporter [Patescibacteria group bacterium]|nr:AI-2E family transporter [Patescibacteria group bacterium]